jgi:ABC-2 type transport system permease protein
VRVLLIIIKEFKQNIRNWKANSMMVLIPIVLIIILGAAFAGAFDSTVKLGGINVLYTVRSGQYLEDGFKSFVKELNDGVGITFEETDDVEEGMESVRNTRYSCYILVADNPEEIKLYKNERYEFNANLVQSLMKMFSERYSAIAELNKQNPEITEKILSDRSMDYVKTVALDKKRQPGALDYYAVSMLTLILMYASLTGLWAIKDEQNLKTGGRILCSPVTKPEYLLGKVLGGILVTIVQAGMVVLFSKFILKAYWGTDLFTIMLMVLAQSVMAISMGTGIAFLIRNDGAATGVLNVIIPIVVFFGGGYTPLENLGPVVTKLSVISPLKWINEAIFRVIYSNDYSLVFIALLISLSVAAAFILISAMLSRKVAV